MPLTVVLLRITGKLHLQVCANLEVVPEGFKLSLENRRISENAGQSAVGSLGEFGVSQIGLKLSLYLGHGWVQPQRAG